MWWNSTDNTTLDDGDDASRFYAEQMEAIRREEGYRRQRQEQYDRLVAEGYYDSQGALDIRRN